MKKLLVLLFTVALFVLAFTSCGFNPKTTEALMKKIDKKMDALDSYQTDMEMNLSTEINGYQCVADMKGKGVLIHGDKGRFYYYDFAEGTTEIRDTEKNEVIESIATKTLNAFHEGNMYVMTQQGDIDQKLYSPLTKNEYLAYLEKQESEFDIDFESCVNKNFEKNEDGSWVLKYSGYTKKTIDDIVEMFGGDDLFEESIEDMEIVINVNADFTVKNMEIEMIFENESTTSEFRMSMKYSKYNEATVVTDISLNTNDYKEIADCRLLTEIEDMLEELEEAENGSFELDLVQKLKTTSPSYESTSSENDRVTYGKKDGKYFYDITASYDNGIIEMSYENGKQTITMSGVTETVDQTEKEAKAFISGLINTAQYEAMRVTDISTKDGVYTITCKQPNESLYQPVFSSLGILNPTVTQTIKVTVQDGNITKIENKVSASAYSSYYGTVSFTFTSENDFTK
jgi:hypothetical protein